MTTDEIIAAADEALRRASAPICYLHRTEKEGAFAVVMEISHLHKIEALIDSDLDAEITELVMSHGHVGGDEEGAYITDKMVKRALEVLDDVFDHMLPDADGEDYRIVRRVLEAALSA